MNNHIQTALVQFNPTVGALEQNADAILSKAQEAASAGAQLIVFPELALCGYPPEDLILRPHFIEDCNRQLDRLASALPPEVFTVVGAPVTDEAGRTNAAIVFHGGEITGIYRKMLLPNYGVFDEKRVFSPGTRGMVIAAGFARIGVHVCEDSWPSAADALVPLKDAGLDLLVNVSASPFYRGKVGVRETVLRNTGAFLGCAVAYCNLVGGHSHADCSGDGGGRPSGPAAHAIQPDGAAGPTTPSPYRVADARYRQ